MKGWALATGLFFAIIISFPQNGSGQTAQEHFRLGLEMAKRKRIDEAIFHFEKARNLAPSNPNVHYNLANAYFMKGDYEDAAHSYRRTIALDQRRVDAHFNLAIVYGILGRIDDAMSSLREVLKINPRDAEAHYLLARAYYFKREYAKAWAHHEEAKKAGWIIPQEMTEAIKKMKGKGRPSKR